MCLAVPGKIVSTNGEGVLRSGRISFGGIVKEANLAYVPEAQIGDFVLVHAGFAITQIDESEANRVFEYLKLMGDLQEIGEA